MFKNYLKIAVRNIKNQKAFSFINIFGLTTSLAAFLLIALYIFDELTYDRFHKNVNSVYRIIETKTSEQGKETKVVSVAYNISEALKKEVPEVAAATRFSMLGRSNILNNENEKVFYESYFLANESFLKVFSFPVIQGNPAGALTAPYSVVLTDETAIKIFGSTNVVGKVLRTEGDSTPYKITAVISIPNNSHLKFNTLFSESSLNSNEDFRNFMAADWNSNTFVTYVQLKNNNEKQTAAKIEQLVKRNRKEDKGKQSRFEMQALKDIHFYSADIEGELGNSGNITHMYVFGIVAFLVLLIACINYMNLTTAKFAGRSKEIAVRKVAGASQKSLVQQFLTEASLITFTSLVLALITVKLALPAFNAFTEKKLNLGFETDYRIWIGTALLIVFVSLLSGFYPAFIQSKLKPDLLLKNKFIPGKGNLSLRRVLVVFQFSLSIIMIIATIIVYQQLKYIDTKDMGFNKQQLLVVDINSGLVRRSAETIKTEFSHIPSVETVSTTSRVPGEWKIIPKVKVRTAGRFTSEGEDIYFMGADDQFLKTFHISLLAGRNFSKANLNDSTSVLINEAAAKMMGISTPTEQMIEIPSVAFSGNASSFEQPFKARIIGIVRDFNFRSLREAVAPMIIAYQKNPVHQIDYFTLKIEPDNMAQTLKKIEYILNKIDPSHLFEYNFLDKKWDVFYREDEKRQVIFLSVAALTILIACLGLFGLATYAAEQRIKEIGIRKVLGASISSVVTMLSADFLKLVLIAAVIALPVAWWTMDNWLQDFAYRINISWWVFMAAGALALLIALVTVSFQAIKAAIANPVKSLRSE